VRAERDRPDPSWDAGAAFIVKSVSAGTFSNFRGDLFGIFWRESSYKAKMFRANAQKKYPAGRDPASHQS